jgi:hypothetical protein
MLARIRQYTNVRPATPEKHHRKEVSFCGNNVADVERYQNSPARKSWRTIGYRTFHGSSGTVDRPEEKEELGRKQEGKDS